MNNKKPLAPNIDSAKRTSRTGKKDGKKYKKKKNYHIGRK